MTRDSGRMTIGKATDIPNHTPSCYVTHQDFKKIKDNYNEAKAKNAQDFATFKEALLAWEASKKTFKGHAEVFFKALDERKIQQADCRRCQINESIKK